MKGSAALRKEVGGGDCWNGFRPGDWHNSINVRDFIVRNVKPYPGNEDFLAGAIAAHKSRLGKTAAVLRRRAKEGSARG